MLDQNAEAVAFLGRILNQARRHRRHDMTTNFTVEDLLVALGFSSPSSDSLDAGAGRRSSQRQAADGGRPPATESDPSKTKGGSE